jgi:hypothetical protein
MRNNFGHKVSQTKRIQLSTAAKRCKSAERASATDNNHPHRAISEDGEAAEEEAELEEANSGCNASSNQSTDSPTLVKVKTWYTESSIVLPQHLA